MTRLGLYLVRFRKKKRNRPGYPRVYTGVYTRLPPHDYVNTTRCTPGNEGRVRRRVQEIRTNPSQDQHGKGRMLPNDESNGSRY